MFRVTFQIPYASRNIPVHQSHRHGFWPKSSLPSCCTCHCVTLMFTIFFVRDNAVMLLVFLLIPDPPITTRPGQEALSYCIAPYCITALELSHGYCCGCFGKEELVMRLINHADAGPRLSECNDECMFSNLNCRTTNNRYLICQFCQSV